MYPPLFTSREAYQLNTLLGRALSEPELRQRLLTHDETLIPEFTLHQSTWRVITNIQALSVEEFCQQLVFLEMKP